GCSDYGRIASDCAIKQMLFADANRWERRWDRAAREKCLNGRAGGHTYGTTAEIRGDNMHRDWRILEIWKRNIALNESSQIGRIDQIIRAAHAPEYASKRYRKHVLSPQSAPNLFKFVDSIMIGSAGEVRRIHGADRGAYDKVRVHSDIQQLPQHSNLDRSQAATAREDKSRPLCDIGHDQMLTVCLVLPIR